MFKDGYDIAQSSTVFPPEQESKVVSFNENGTPIIKVVGVGGGGDNAVDHMFEQGIDGVSFVVTNTDRQALETSKVPNQLLLGPQTCRGLGAGNEPGKAKKAAEESSEDIAKLFDEDTKLVFITAGMGGGTGTGAGPIVAKISREMGKLTIGIVTIPFLFEGKKKIVKALDGASEMSKYVDALLVINNQRLTEIYPDLDFDNAFDKADDTLTIAAKSISDMINMRGKINLDFEDINTTLRNGGTAIISSGYGEGEKRVTAAIRDALNSPLLKNQDIKTSKRFLFVVYYSRENNDRPFKMGEMDEIDAFMANFAQDVDVIWGSAVDNSLGNKVKITILAAGFDATIGDFDQKKEIKLSDSNDQRKAPTQISIKEEKPDDDKRIEDIYGQELVATRKMDAVASRYIVLTKEQMDNDAVINFIEKNATFARGMNIELQEEWKNLVADKNDDNKTLEKTNTNTKHISFN